MLIAEKTESLEPFYVLSAYFRYNLKKWSGLTTFDEALGALFNSRKEYFK